MTCKYFTSIVHHLVVDAYDPIIIIYSLYTDSLDIIIRIIKNMRVVFII